MVSVSFFLARLNTKQPKFNNTLQKAFLYDLLPQYDEALLSTTITKTYRLFVIPTITEIREVG